MKFLLRCLFLFAAFASGLATAADQAPDAVMRKITDDVIEIVKNDKDIKNGDTRRAIELVESRVLPNFNFARMTQLAVGRGWRQATPEQQAALTDEFRKLLLRTYSKALTEYKDQTVVIKPAVVDTQGEARVKSEIQQAGAKPVPIDYYLEKSSGAWRVFDLEISGVSLVTNYRESFSSEIRSNGIDGLIVSLKDKNKSRGQPGAAKS